MKRPFANVPAAAGELARWMGRREAFGLVSGSCSAAEAESLRRIRDEKHYLAVAPNWGEFCKLHLRVSRRSADRTIGYLEEFGPSFFHLTQLAHVTPGDFRAIAAHVSDCGVKLDGSVVALLPENAGKLTEAISELLQRAEPKPGAPAPVPLPKALQRCQALAEMLRQVPCNLNAIEKLDLAAAITEVRNAAAGLGAIVWW